MTGTPPVGPDDRGPAQSVLVVEDDEELRKVIVRHLVRWGFAPMEASDGGIALEEFRRERGSLGAILLDIMLPVLDGVEVARQVLAERPGMPIVAYSAAFNDQIEADLREIGVENFLAKPFRAEELLTKLREAIAGPI